MLEAEFAVQVAEFKTERAGMETVWYSYVQSYEYRNLLVPVVCVVQEQSLSFVTVNLINPTQLKRSSHHNLSINWYQYHQYRRP